MTREDQLLKRIATDLASDILKKRENPEYQILWDRESCVRKLSSVFNITYKDAASKFDTEINSQIKILKRSRI
jgi:hypothetical protein